MYPDCNTHTKTISFGGKFYQIQLSKLKYLDACILYVLSKILIYKFQRIFVFVFLDGFKNKFHKDHRSSAP